MTSKQDFDETEWQTLIKGPAIAGLMAVTAESLALDELAATLEIDRGDFAP